MESTEIIEIFSQILCELGGYASLFSSFLHIPFTVFCYNHPINKNFTFHFSPHKTSL